MLQIFFFSRFNECKKKYFDKNNCQGLEMLINENFKDENSLNKVKDISFTMSKGRGQL